MNYTRPTIFMVFFLSIFSIQSTPENNFLSPLLSPIFHNICESIGCGEGTCKETSDSMFGYECDCKTGWMQFHMGESLRFLPCVIPNCTINYSCFNQSIAPAPSPLQDTRNFSLLDPCSWAYCGGGKCEESSDLGGHKCECEEEFSNLLNITTFPCYRNCSLGANCADLGLTLPNSSSSAPSPDLSVKSNSSNAYSLGTNSLLALLIMISLAFKY